MNVDSDLPARLSALADDLTGPEAAVSPDAVVCRHRRQRRARVGLLAVVAAVVALVVAVPTAIGSLSANPGGAAGPGGTATGAGSEQEAARAAQEAALRAAAEQQLAALRSRPGGPVVLSATVSWHAGPEDPAAASPPVARGCPDLHEVLGQAFGVDVMAGAPTGPAGGQGCSWATAHPPTGSEEAAASDYRFDVRFLVGTTAEEYANSYAVAPEMRRCPAATSPDGQLLMNCSGLDGTGATHLVLVVPDAGGVGTWVLGARVGPGAPHAASDALTVLVDQAPALDG